MNYNNVPRHLIAVDCVILGYEESELKLLLTPRLIDPEKGRWSLLGGFVFENESFEDAAMRVLKTTTGLTEMFLEQVFTFSDPHRDSGGRVVSSAYYALVKIVQQNKNLVREHGAHWWPVSSLPSLIFDHQQMVEKSLRAIQQSATNQLIGRELLPEFFTITELRNLYNQIFQCDFDPGNFRKKVLTLNVIEKINKKDMSSSRKGAFLYKFADNEKGFSLRSIF